MPRHLCIQRTHVNKVINTALIIWYRSSGSRFRCVPGRAVRWVCSCEAYTRPSRGTRAAAFAAARCCITWFDVALIRGWRGCDYRATPPVAFTRGIPRDPRVVRPCGGRWSLTVGRQNLSVGGEQPSTTPTKFRDDDTGNGNGQGEAEAAITFVNIRSACRRHPVRDL